MNLTNHKNILLRGLGEDAVKLLKTTNAIIAGGAITSIFSGTEINDYDIYFRSHEDIITFIRNTYNEEGDAEKDDAFPLTEETFLDLGGFEFICHNHTSRSISYTHNGLNLQLIHFEYFQTAHDVFQSYDFHMNMGAFDFKLDQFVLHENFITTVASRRLTFNAGTRYPIMSSLRVSKYLERGYTISRKEMFKIGLAIANLNIDSWDALEDQLSGFYGIDVSDMFDRTVPFSMEVAMDMINCVQDLAQTPHDTQPTIQQLFFTVLGNPHREQRVFFKRLVEDADGTYSYVYDRDEKYKIEETVKIKKVRFDTDYEELKNNSHSYWHFGSNNQTRIGVFVLETDGHKMNMGHSGLELSGNIKLIAVKDPTQN